VWTRRQFLFGVLLAGCGDDMANTTIIVPLAENTGVKVQINASRLTGVSPCTVVFSCDGTTTEGYDDHEIWRQFGYYFDFDDPKSGTYNTIRGGSKNISIGGPMAAHTFEVADGGGRVDFDVLVNVKGPLGELGRGLVTITVEAQDSFYAGADTILVSDSLNVLTDWSTLGFDKSPPALADGAVQLNTMPAWDAMSGKRVMIHRGSDYQSIVKNIKYGSSNIAFTDFGNNADPNAIMGEFHLGAVSDSGGGFATQADDTDYAAFGPIWLDNVSIDSLKVRFVGAGMSFNHITLHNLDMDWSAENLSGQRVALNGTRSADKCLITANNMNPASVPIPVGFYVSDVNMLGALDKATNPTGSAIYFNPWPILWGCVIGSHVSRLEEHGIRTHAIQRNFIGETDVLGEHTVAAKSEVTVRGRGYNQIGDWTGKTYADFSTSGLGATEDVWPSTQWGVLQRLTVGAGSEAVGTRAVAISPSADSTEQLMDDHIARDIIFQDDPSSALGDVYLVGRWISTVLPMTYQGTGAVDNGTQNVLNSRDLGSGTPSLTPNYIDSTAVPVPAAPR